MATGANSYLAIHEMTGAPNEVPATPAMQKIGRISDDQLKDPVFLASNTISGDRRQSPGKYLRDDVTWNLAYEQCYLGSGDTDPLTLAGLKASGWAETTSSNGWLGVTLEGATLTASGSTLTLTGAAEIANITLAVGQAFRIRGAANAGNNQIYEVTEVAGDVYTVTPAIAVDETCGASVFIDGRTAVDGATKRPIMTERGHSDTDSPEYFVLLGNEASVFTLNYNDGEVGTAAIDFIGLLELDPSNDPITGATYTDIPEQITYSVNKETALYIDGVLVEDCMVQSLTVSVDHKGEGTSGIGVAGFCRVDIADLEITVNLTAMFNDSSWRLKMRNQEYISFSIILSGTNGSQRRVHVPAAQFSSDSIPVGGPEKIVQNATARGYRDPDVARAIQIDDFPAVS